MGMPRFPLVRVKGSNYDMGYQHGKICEKKIKEYLQAWRKIIKGAAPRVGNKEILQKAETFIGPVKDHAPHLAEEIEGLAKGASISRAEAYILQIRFELLFMLMPQEACTSFAISGAHTADGFSLCGQNVDAQAEIEDFGIMLHSTPAKGPQMLIYTSVGQIGYMGINSEGLGCYGNMTNCAGWRAGVPRYILFRLILESNSIEDAHKVFDLPRGASLNYMMVDAARNIESIETTVDDYSVLRAENGFLAHSNHYLDNKFVHEDTLVAGLPDSRLRLARINRYLSEEIVVKHKKMTVAQMHAILCDHENHSRSICRHIDLNPRTDTEKQFRTLKTIASMISKPEAGETYIGVGNPCENERFVYKL